MYTRCPSCRSEISFDPPANKDSLPENYRHRIKCPSCGVTIGVKINQNPQILSQPIGRPQLAPPPGSRPAPRQSATRNSNNYSTTRNNAYGQPRANGYSQQRTNGYNQRQAGYNPQRAYPYNTPHHDPYDDEQSVKETAKPAKATPATSKKAKTKKDVKTKTVTAKKSGIGRNIVMMLFSLVFIAFSVVSYLISKGTFALPEAFKWVAGVSFFDGISVWASIITEFELFKALAQMLGALGTFATLVPLLLFTLSGINFIIAFISAIGKKYGRAFNFLFSFIIGGLAATALFAPYLIASDTDVIGYLVDVIAMEGGAGYMAIAGAVFGVLQFVFSLFFLKSLKRKDAELDTRKGGKSNKKNSKKKPTKKNAKGRR